MKTTTTILLCDKCKKNEVQIYNDRGDCCHQRDGLQWWFSKDASGATVTQGCATGVTGKLQS
jgi:hypothetical protein